MIVRAMGLAAALLCAGCATVEESAEPPRAQTSTPRVAVAPPVKPAAPAPVVPAPTPTIERAAPEPPKASELDSLLAEFERLRRLPASELAREQDAARQNFSQARSDAARIRLAMVSTVPGSSPADEQRALDLLDPLVKTPGAALHSLAFLLSTFIQDQKRLAGVVQGLQQNMQGIQQNNQALQQNVHGLQQKLDALRTLERSLSERGEPAPRKR